MPPSSDNYPLARRIRQRYIQAPGVIRWSDSATVPARAAEFAADRLPLLADVRRRWQPASVGRGAARPSWVHARPAASPAAGDTTRPPIVFARPIPPVTGSTAGPLSAAGVQTKSAGAVQPQTQRLSSSGMLLQKKAPNPGPANDVGPPNTAFPNGTRSSRPAPTDERPGPEPQIRPPIQPAVIVARRDRLPGIQPFSAGNRPHAARSDRFDKAPRTSKTAPATPVSRTHDRLAQRAAGRKSRDRTASPDPALTPESSQEPLPAAAPPKPVQVPSRPLIPLHRAPSPSKSGKLTVHHQVDPSRQGRRPSGGIQFRPPAGRQTALDYSRLAAGAEAFVQSKTAAPGPVGQPTSPSRRPAPAAGVSAGLTTADRDGMARSVAANGAVRSVRQSAQTAARPRDPADRSALGAGKTARPMHAAASARRSDGNAGQLPRRLRSPAGDAAQAAKPFANGGSKAPAISSPAGAPVARQSAQRSGSNFLVTQTATQAANGPLVSRQTVQQPGRNLLMTQVASPAAAPSSSAPLSAALHRQPPTTADRHDPAAGAAVAAAQRGDGRQPPQPARRPPIPSPVMAAPGPWRFSREFSRRPYLQRDNESRSAAAPKAGAQYPTSAEHPRAVSQPAPDRRPWPPVSTRIFRAPAAGSTAASAAAAPEFGNTPATAGAGRQGPAASGGAEFQAPATSAGGEPIDLERLADEVYDIIERRLIVERERSGM